MFLYLSKLLPLLALPPASTLLLLMLTAIFRKRRPALAASLFVVAFVSLYILSTDAAASALLRDLESHYPAPDLLTLPAADAIVVLGGYLRPGGGERRYSEFTEATDRLWTGALLYHAGKAPLVLLTGGNISFLGGTGTPEAVAARQILRDWGVPDKAILVEPNSLNTHENAALSKPMLAAVGARRLLLVTSAYHMPRAVAIFAREGLEVTPVPTDYQTGWGSPDALFRLVPDAEALARSKGALREWFGLQVYRLRGWA